MAWASAALAAGVLLHADRVPLWATAAALALIMWRLAAAMRHVGLPGAVVRTIVALLLVGAVFVRFQTLNGLGPGTVLLVLMSAIKLLETRTRRDEYIIVGGSLFLLLAACLDRQSLVRTPLYLLHTWLSCSALAVIAYSATPSALPSGAGMFDSHAALRLGGRALLYALPLALVLFVFFPRLAGSFWSLPRSEEALTGLSDTMSPGSISKLTSSYEIAFRVRFDGAVPPPHERYWRGPVLHDFDGYTWRRRRDPSYRQQAVESLGNAYRYHVSLEPTQQRWWFSLDTVDGAPGPKVFFAYDYELIAAEPVTEITNYEAVSHTTTRSLEPLSNSARRIETTLPPDRNPRTMKLAQDMRGRAGSDAQFVEATLDYLRTGGFVYSLDPPLLGYDSVDDFLFKSRNGFCGHYASAYVTLMRAAGVPARVVTGYLGGEWNEPGSYYVLRQSDAHSWAEVWLEGRGWTRVDPTAVVEPERLNRGIMDLLPQAGSESARLLRSSPWLTRMLQRWDATNNWWNDHVLKFDYHSQLNLLSRLGFSSPDLQTLGWAFVAALLIWLSWIAWQVGRSTPGPRPDRLARAYARLCKKLAGVGLPRPAYQGPIAFADAVTERRPDLAQSVRSLLTRYAELRYGVPDIDSRAADIVGFERAVARLSVENTP